MKIKVLERYWDQPKRRVRRRSRPDKVLEGAGRSSARQNQRCPGCCSSRLELRPDGPRRMGFRGLVCDGQYLVPEDLTVRFPAVRQPRIALKGVSGRSSTKSGRRCRRKSAAARATENATAGRRRARTELRNQRSSQAALPLETAGYHRRDRGSYG